MNRLELWRLKQLCKERSLDVQEIDDSLTYWENKKHLLSLAHSENGDWDSEQEWYDSEHFLTYYVTCILEGSTKSEEVGAPLQSRFSLATYIKQR